MPSYTPTINALAHARRLEQTQKRQVNEKTSILVVTMPTTRGQKPLTGVTEEKQAIARSKLGLKSFSALECPAAREVLHKIPKFDIIHFACHGSSDRADPSKSHLILQKTDTTGPVVDKLAIADIADAQTLGKAWIAYLSACSTAEVEAFELADEGLHLASAFQVAGFPHVVGSMWSADDDTCARMAKLFYNSLTDECEIDPSGGAVAAALRKAVLQVRSEHVDDPKFWAPFIHLGA